MKLSALSKLLILGVMTYGILRLAIVPPLPSSVIEMYMAIIAFSLLLYFSIHDNDLEEITVPIIRLLTDKKYTIPLLTLLIVIPLLVGWRVYLNRSGEIRPPVGARTIHPAPPREIYFKGKTIDLLHFPNPYRRLEREDLEAFRKHVEEGREIYYQNCVFCHGDRLDGTGIYAHGLDPLPANFQDGGTIAQLQEAYLFWRIAKGGVGLPEESAPWSSSMPAWEKFLAEEDIWKVILFLYDFTGYRPRAEGEIQ